MKILLTFLLILSSSVAFAQGSADWEELNNYSGIIGNDLKICMTLLIKDKDVTGVYFYNKWLKDITIRGKIDGKRGIELKEYDQSGKVTGLFKGHFLEPNPKYYENIEGMWSRPDGMESKKFKVTLDNVTYRPLGHGRYYVAGFKNDHVVETFVQKFRKAVIAKDKVGVASMVRYPIDVNIGTKKVAIKNKAALIENYDQIFHSTLYEQIKSSVPHNLFVKATGVMLGNGEVWFGLENNKISVIAINN